MEKEEFLYKLDLQLFGDDAEDEEEQKEEETEGEEENQEDNQDEEEKEDEKKDDKKDITLGGTKMSKEDAMKLLGIKDTKILDTVLAVQKATTKANPETSEAEERVLIAELKADLLLNDVKTNYIDDAIAIVQAKIKSGVNQKDAITLLKKNHSAFFKEDGVEEGTGRNAGHARKGKGKVEGIGERLAKQAISTKPKKSYFE